MYYKVYNTLYNSEQKGEIKDMTNTPFKKPTVRTVRPAISNTAAMQPQIPEVTAFDLGYAQCKGVAAGWSCIFPSVVKRRSEVVVSGLQDSEGYVVTDESGMWNVGAKGSYNFSAERLVNESDMPKFLAMLGLWHQETGKSVIDVLVSGLPVDDFKVEANRDAFTTRLQGDFNFGFGNTQNFIQVKKSLVLPQSAGAFFDYTLDEDGTANEDNADLALQDVLMLDLGGKSSDGCIMEGGFFSQDSFTIWHGVHRVRDELRKLIAKYHKYTTPLYKMDEVLKTGCIDLGGTSINVEDLLGSAVYTVFPELMDELSMYVPDFRRFAAVLLCGGGANLYYEYIRDLAGVPVILVDNPEYANANGYRKFGMLKLKEGLI